MTNFTIDRRAQMITLNYASNVQDGGEVEGISVYIVGEDKSASATFDVLADDSTLDSAYLITNVEVYHNAIPGLFIAAQVQGGKEGEVTPKVIELLKRLHQ